MWGEGPDVETAVSKKRSVTPSPVNSLSCGAHSQILRIRSNLNLFVIQPCYSTSIYSQPTYKRLSSHEEHIYLMEFLDSTCSLQGRPKYLSNCMLCLGNLKPAHKAYNSHSGQPCKPQMELKKFLAQIYSPKKDNPFHINQNYFQALWQKSIFLRRKRWRHTIKN